MMNDRITLQERADTTDGAGQPIESWSTLTSLWADVKFLSGVETIRSNAETSVTNASIRVRTTSLIKTSMRVLFKEWVFDVKSALPDAKDRAFMFLVCEAVK